MFQLLAKQQSAALPSRERRVHTSKILLCDACLIWRRWLKKESQEDACGVQEAAAECSGTRGAAGTRLSWKEKQRLLAPSRRSVPKSPAVGAANHCAELPVGFQPVPAEEPHQGCEWAATRPGWAFRQSAPELPLCWLEVFWLPNNSHRRFCASGCWKGLMAGVWLLWPPGVRH